MWIQITTYNDLNTWEIPYPVTLRNHSSSQLLILKWTRTWGPSSNLVETESDDGRCKWTNDQNKLPAAHAVLFNFEFIYEKDVNPWKFYRDVDQVFIWQTIESAGNVLAHGFDLTRYDGFFNWTMSPRRVADVPDPYGTRELLIEQLEFGREVVTQLMNEKKRMALWLVSDCSYTHGASKRLQLTNQLVQSGASIDRFGSCFHNSHLFPFSEDMFKTERMRAYKFYIAFENSLHCSDYITEKFWDNSLRAGAVPVVWGPTKDDLISVAPPNSFIFAEDFESMEDLAKYLIYLDQNDEEYRKYLRWRENKEISIESIEKEVEEEHPGLDQWSKSKDLCSLLHEKRHQKKIVDSLYSTFVEGEPAECIKVHTRFKIKGFFCRLLGRIC